MKIFFRESQRAPKGSYAFPAKPSSSLPSMDVLDPILQEKITQVVNQWLKTLALLNGKSAAMLALA